MNFKDFTSRLFPNPNDVEDSYENDYENQDEEIMTSSAHTQENAYQPRSGANVVMGTSSAIEMKVVTPKSYETVTQIADLLLSKKTVLLNLENTNRETARRLIDFLSGAAYALSGGIQKVADNTYAITPSNVAVSREAVGMAAQAQPQQAAPEVPEDGTAGF